jgi:hypothetical protein
MFNPELNFKAFADLNSPFFTAGGNNGHQTNKGQRQLQAVRPVSRNTFSNQC